MTSNHSFDTQRKRGRPSGKSRVPLSEEERKARNAAYERQRRNLQSELTSQLAEAAGFDPRTSKKTLLDGVTQYLKQCHVMKLSEKVLKLRQQNEMIISQIASLEERLLNDEIYVKTPQPTSSADYKQCTRMQSYKGRKILRKIKKMKMAESEPMKFSLYNTPPQSDSRPSSNSSSEIEGVA